MYVYINIHIYIHTLRFVNEYARSCTAAHTLALASEPHSLMYKYIHTKTHTHTQKPTHSRTFANANCSTILTLYYKTITLM